MAVTAVGIGLEGGRVGVIGRRLDEVGEGLASFSRVGVGEEVDSFPEVGVGEEVDVGEGVDPFPEVGVGEERDVFPVAAKYGFGTMKLMIKIRKLRMLAKTASILVISPMVFFFLKIGFFSP